MKKIILSSIVLTVLALVCGTNAANAQDEKKMQELAVRLVKSASVKPGDVVVIEGGKHMIPLMEAVAVEVNKAGGMSNMMLDTDRTQRSFYMDVPNAYLEQEPRYLAEWFKNTNVLIGLPSVEDSKAVFEGIPQERLAKRAKAGEFFNEIINSLPLRLVGIELPNEKDAALYGVDFPTYKKMITDAINADYQAISIKGNELKKMLQNAKQIRVTNPAGTDFTFSPAAARAIFLDDGIVTPEEANSKKFIERFASLPGGSLGFAPSETSANGKIVVKKDMCKFAPMTDISFEFKDGMMRNFKAGANGNCFEEAMKLYTGPKEMFGIFSIGLNPNLRVIEDGGANFRPSNAAGMVQIGIGDNQIFGGNNKTNGGYGFAITNATVTVDGKTVIKNGKLNF